jgi:GWxTD domain-containing protein
VTRPRTFVKFIVLSQLAFFAFLSFPSARAQESAAAHNDLYEKGLDDDVRWIITDEERADFKKLPDDKRRDQFIEAFWNRRNPIPGAAENTFKEEHYRRLAYASQHFAAGIIPGWKTDRGRFYIMYGPPDYIARHVGSYGAPRSGEIKLSGYNSEEWRWKYIKGLGCNVVLEFEDKCECGEYHLTLGDNGVSHQASNVTPRRQLGPDCLIDQILFP